MRDVRVCLDENVTSAPLLEVGDTDTLSLDEIVRSKLTEGVDMAHRLASVYRLEEGHGFGESVFWGDLESGWTPLPDDFMRLTVFEMSDWERAVYSAISPGDLEYALQRQRVKALRGTAQRPVCAICIRPEGKVLEFYSCKSENATVRRAQYIPYSRIDDNGGIDISERCYRGAVYMAASLTLHTLGETEKGKVLAEIAKTALQ